VIVQRESDEVAVTSVGVPPVLLWLEAQGTRTDRTALNDLWGYDSDFQR
jgi:hypothetical protein